MQAMCRGTDSSPTVIYPMGDLCGDRIWMPNHVRCSMIRLWDHYVFDNNNSIFFIGIIISGGGDTSHYISYVPGVAVRLKNGCRVTICVHTLWYASVHDGGELRLI